MALAALLGGAVGIAFAPIFVRLSEVGPSATAFYRLLFALPVVWLWMKQERLQEPFRRPAGARDYRMLALAGFFFAGDLAFWHWSIRLTSVANATLLANFAPIFVTLGARVLFGERITGRFVLGMALAFAGAAMLLGVSFQLTLRHLAGDALGLITALFYAGYMLTVKHLRRSFSTATLMTYSGMTSCAVLLVVALLSGESLLAVSAKGWAVLVLLALISHVGGQSLIAYGFGHLPASFSSLSLLLQPAVAALLAWGILGEPVGAWQAVGGGVILCGIALAAKASEKG
ncbi:MAG: DMT family transporter [Verrucomicrobiota bacterium]